MISRTTFIGLFGVALLALTAALLWGSYRDTVNERDQLRFELASAQAALAAEAAIDKTTAVVLKGREQSRISIQQRAADVQEAINSRLAGPPACVLPPDWRLLHDAAASDLPVPPAAAGSDAAAVTPQEAARTVTGNYAQCHDIADQLRALQLWNQGVANENP